eukprot:scaffold1373_cov367-Pinguiococcus_pyrenoidosus.AAC.16
MRVHQVVHQRRRYASQEQEPPKVEHLQGSDDGVHEALFTQRVSLQTRHHDADLLHIHQRPVLHEYIGQVRAQRLRPQLEHVDVPQARPGDRLRRVCVGATQRVVVGLGGVVALEAPLVQLLAQQLHDAVGAVAVSQERLHGLHGMQADGRQQPAGDVGVAAQDEGVEAFAHEGVQHLLGQLGVGGAARDVHAAGRGTVFIFLRFQQRLVVAHVQRLHAGHQAQARGAAAQIRLQELLRRVLVAAAPVHRQHALGVAVAKSRRGHGGLRRIGHGLHAQLVVQRLFEAAEVARHCRTHPHGRATGRKRRHRMLRRQRGDADVVRRHQRSRVRVADDAQLHVVKGVWQAGLPHGGARPHGGAAVQHVAQLRVQPAQVRQEAVLVVRRVGGQRQLRRRPGAVHAVLDGVGVQQQDVYGAKGGFHHRRGRAGPRHAHAQRRAAQTHEAVEHRRGGLVGREVEAEGGYCLGVAVVVVPVAVLAKAPCVRLIPLQTPR